MGIGVMGVDFAQAQSSCGHPEEGLEVRVLSGGAGQ